MNGLPYYKAYPRDFIEGTIGMDFETKGAYRLILDLIYMQGGKLPDDARYISGQLGCSVRKWSAIRSSLIEAGKITSDGDSITNDRAIIELESLRKLQDKQRENRSRPNKNNNLQSPRSDHTEPDTEEEKEDTNVSSKKNTSSKLKGTRLPVDWRLPKSWGDWAVTIEGLPEADVRREGERFRDYWTGVSGARGVKRDWQATWRNWVRKNREDARARSKPRSNALPEIGEQRKLNDGRLLEYAGAVDGWMEVME